MSPEEEIKINEVSAHFKNAAQAFRKLGEVLVRTHCLPIIRSLIIHCKDNHFLPGVAKRNRVFKQNRKKARK